MDDIKIKHYVKTLHRDDCVGEVVFINDEFITFTDLVTCKDVIYKRCELTRVQPTEADRIVQKHTKPILKYGN